MLGALLGAGVSILGSVIGGKSQSKAADKAAQAEIQMAREAQAARERAAQQVQALQAPGVAVYNQGLNALTGRITGYGGGGVPAGAGPAAPTAGSPDYDAYISQYGDVAAEGQRVLSQTPGYIGDLDGDGQETVRDYGVYHHRTFNDRPVPTTPAPTTAAPAEEPAFVAPRGTFGNALNPTYEAPVYTPPPAFEFDIEDFVNNPAYKFALEQGSGQIMASAAQTGALQSGAALKALQDRGQKTAYGFYDDERDFAWGKHVNERDFGRSNFESDRGFGRDTYENDRNYLTSRYDQETEDMFRLLGIGQNALNSTTNAIVGEGNATATGLENIGASRAGNALAQGNIWSGVAGDVTGALAGLLKPKGGLVKDLNLAAAQNPNLF